MKVTTKLPPGKDLDLLLVGKIGHGKSSTGNSILGEPKFKASASSQAETSESELCYTTIDGRVIKVVDSPGVMDPKKTCLDFSHQAISIAIAMCPDGFHALLVVIQFGQRMTNEEKEAIKMLKSILGENVIKNNSVCIVTHGDAFKTKVGGDKTFQEWCKSQSGFLKELFEECQYRCVLFDNEIKDPKRRKLQVIELVNTVDGLSLEGERYTSSIFDVAKAEYKKQIKEENIPEADPKINRNIQLLNERLDRFKETSNLWSNENETELKELQSSVDKMIYSITVLKLKQNKSSEFEAQLHKLKDILNKNNSIVKECDKMLQTIKGQLLVSEQEIKSANEKVVGKVAEKVKTETGWCSLL